MRCPTASSGYVRYPVGPSPLIIILVAAAAAATAVAEVRFARGLVIQSESSTFTSIYSYTNRTVPEVTTDNNHHRAEEEDADDKKWFLCVEWNMEAKCVHRPLNSH